LMLMVVAAVPFPTSLLGRYGGQTWGVVPYAAAMVLLQVLFGAMWWWALRHGLLADDVDSRQEARAGLARNTGIGLVFAASIPVAFVDPDLAKYLWLLLIIVPGLVSRLVRRRTAGTG
jgi:Na+-transporting NADH:ubiquinone oxidoreductase subunit NqrB